MKKLFIIGILVASLLIAMPAMAAEYTLFANQTEIAGTVTVTNDATDLTITYTLDEGWEMNESHVAVASDVTGIPQSKKGNAIPGRFAYAAEHQPPVITYTYTIPLADLPAAETFAIAAQADLVHVTDSVYDREEGAWAGVDEVFEGKDWDLYFTYTPAFG
jgi:hypothetical protein